MGAVEPATALDGEVAADVVIVGGGYAGMWTAWLIREAEPTTRVVLLERDVCAHGPSGRNGGFANSMWFSLASMRRRFGEVGAIGGAQQGRLRGPVNVGIDHPDTPAEPLQCDREIDGDG